MIVWSTPSYLADWRVATVGAARVGYIAPPVAPDHQWQWCVWLTQRGFPKQGLASSEEQARAAISDAWGEFLTAAGLQMPARDDRPCLRFRLPLLPPSLWKLYDGWGQNRRKSKEYKSWRTDVGWFIKPLPPVPISKPFDIVISMTRHSSLMDVDNRIKPVLDCLEHYKVIKNDNLCARATIQWGEDLGHECIAELREVTA